MAQEMVSLETNCKEQNDTPNDMKEHAVRLRDEDANDTTSPLASTDGDDEHDRFFPPPTGNNFERIRMIRSIAFLTAILEGLTCFMRFGLGMQSTRDTAGTVGRLTGGLRIHHGYVGLVLVLMARYCCTHRHCSRRWQWWLQIWGWSLVASDLIHHFLVLWPITGSPQFDLTYPK